MAVAVLLARRLHAPLALHARTSADRDSSSSRRTLVQILAGVADNFITNVHIGRSSRWTARVPRLGADVPRWYGETIGFWDKDALITWTSNIQGWTVHGKFEFSSKMQTIEIYTPNRDAAGQVHRPRITKRCSTIPRRSWSRSASSATTRSRAASTRAIRTTSSSACRPSIPVKGKATPVSPGKAIEYEVPDMYGRPWAQIWEKYYEQGMERPEGRRTLFNFE